MRSDNHPLEWKTTWTEKVFHHLHTYDMPRWILKIGTYDSFWMTVIWLWIADWIVTKETIDPIVVLHNEYIPLYDQNVLTDKSIY